MKLSFTKSWTVILTLLALTFSAIGVTPAFAAGIVVNSLLATTAVDSNCTLREAIQNANDNAATNAECAAGSGADTITFSVSGTIKLGTQLPDITDAAGLTMDGTGQTLTISGGNVTRVLLVQAGASLTLKHLTIANGNYGYAGGGIYNLGALTITDSVFSGNSAANKGGGIYNIGTLNITNSAFSANSVTGGSISVGGIYNGWTAAITNSTFSGNSATGGFGGGVYNSGTLTITNSTFSGNSATTGGGAYSDNSLNITNSAVSSQ